MTWNYRVFKRVIGRTESFHIREVYYRGEKPVAYSSNDEAPMGSTVAELRRDLRMMLRDTYKSKPFTDKTWRKVKR